MNILLDTHMLLWWLQDAAELGERARDLISDSSHLIYVSAASVWEMRIKQAIGKLELPDDFAAVLAERPSERSAVAHEHAHEVSRLPMLHRDPFDRMLSAQARFERLQLLTRDESFTGYDLQLLVA